MTTILILALVAGAFLVKGLFFVVVGSAIFGALRPQTQLVVVAPLPAPPIPQLQGQVPPTVPRRQMSMREQELLYWARKDAGL